MSTLQAKSLDRPDETREFPRGAAAVVTVGDSTVTRAEFRPGWRWSNDVRPTAERPAARSTTRGI
jgi:hypothetical protein